MEFSVSLQENYQLNNKPIFTFVIIVAAIFAIYGIVLLIIKLMPKPKPVDADAAWKALSPAEKNMLRNKYLMLIDGLYMKVRAGGISDRMCFHTLSKYVREFISDFTGVKVSRCTLNEIKNMNAPVLANLIEEFYAVEFAKISEGDEITAIEKTKWIIRGWNL
ncbi:MAG: hypothetical protein MJ105_05495 [Lachnospiraceae bacterium]|nr:hypothetical protein [Lachnospiraceae bacterium]